MPDPVPKAAALRVRNSSTKVTRVGGERPAVVPVCPEGLGEEARRWWEVQWSSDIAGIWLVNDVPVVRRLVRIVDLDERGEASAALLGEARQLEDRLGLSPLSRRRLQWEVSQVAGERGDGAALVVEDAGERWLKAVSD